MFEDHRQTPRDDHPATNEELTMPDKLISDLLDLPDKVHRGDFVLNLSKGVTEPVETLEQYVVTPQLAGGLRQCPGLHPLGRRTP